jgi:hypothetical protein
MEPLVTQLSLNVRNFSVIVLNFKIPSSIVVNTIQPEIKIDIVVKTVIYALIRKILDAIKIGIRSFIKSSIQKPASSI